MEAAESAELQIASISAQYRTLLIEKESEVKKLQSELFDAKTELDRQLTAPAKTTAGASNPGRQGEVPVDPARIYDLPADAVRPPEQGPSPSPAGTGGTLGTLAGPAGSHGGVDELVDRPG